MSLARLTKVFVDRWLRFVESGPVRFRRIKLARSRLQRSGPGRGGPVRVMACTFAAPRASSSWGDDPPSLWLVGRWQGARARLCRRPIHVIRRDVLSARSSRPTLTSPRVLFLFAVICSSASVAMAAPGGAHLGKCPRATKRVVHTVERRSKLNLCERAFRALQVGFSKCERLFRLFDLFLRGVVRLQQ